MTCSPSPAPRRREYDEIPFEELEESCHEAYAEAKERLKRLANSAAMDKAKQNNHPLYIRAIEAKQAIHDGFLETNASKIHKYIFVFEQSWKKIFMMK
jgi:hypothetical protein